MLRGGSWGAEPRNGLGEPSPAMDLDGIMTHQSWELLVASTAVGFVFCILCRPPEVAKRYSCTVTVLLGCASVFIEMTHQLLY